MRQTLESAGSLEERVKLGSLLADMGRQAGLTDEEVATFDRVRDFPLL